MAYSLTYSYDSTSQSYSVTGWSGITTDKVVIPSTYNDGVNGEHPVTSIGSDAFNNCRSLTSITIPNSVTSIGDSAFYECKSLKSVNIPNSVETIKGSAFTRCESLTSITIPNSVKSIGWYLFERCINLTSATLSDSITRVSGQMFKDCVNLKSIIIPDSVTQIQDLAFGNCRSLKTVALLSETPPTLVSNAIPSTVSTIYVPQSSKEAYKTATNWTAFADKLVSNNLYLSFVQFNIKNKEYIDQKSVEAKDYVDEEASRAKTAESVNAENISKNTSSIEDIKRLIPETAETAVETAKAYTDKVLADAIDQEVAARQQDVSDIQQAHNAEVERATNKENALEASIQGLDTKIEAETTRAEKAETALSEDIATKLDKKNPVIQKSNGTPHVYFFDNDVVYECILTVKNTLNVDGLIYAGGNELRFNNHLSITDNLPAHNEIVKFTPDFVDFNKVITLKAGANVDIVGANNSAVINKKYLYDNLSTVISEDMVNSLF